jgi:DNA-binding transcriptional LysR family regulator
MRMNCEILDIKAFLTVLDVGTFQNAALQLNMSQPTVSRRVKALEATLGATLLQRTTRHLALTSVGQALEPHLRRIVSEFEECAFSLPSSNSQASRKITIASIATAASSFLPHVLKRFASAYPDVQCRIVDLSAEEGLERVAQGEAEFGINFLGRSRGDLTFTPLIEDEMVLTCRTDHAFARRASIRWSDLSGQPLIISQRGGIRNLVDQSLKKSGLRMNWSFEDVHLATSFGLVEAGVGMAIIPRIGAPATSTRSLTTVPVRDPVVRRTVGLIELRKRQLAPPSLALRQILINEMAVRNAQPRETDEGPSRKKRRLRTAR